MNPKEIRTYMSNLDNLDKIVRLMGALDQSYGKWKFQSEFQLFNNYRLQEKLEEHRSDILMIRDQILMSGKYIGDLSHLWKAALKNRPTKSVTASQERTAGKTAEPAMRAHKDPLNWTPKIIDLQGRYTNYHRCQDGSLTPIDSNKDQRCEKCGYFICSHCGACHPLCDGKVLRAQPQTMSVYIPTVPAGEGVEVTPAPFD